MQKAAISKELDIIIKTILENVSAEGIYLFGSYAYGTPREDSDIDIYLVIPDNDSDVIELNAEIRYALYKKLGLPLDLLIAKKSIFERRRRGLTLENVIIQQGVCIYGN
ncbi:MAG: nucleotidyltransferase domain-containing protein [Spirochaetaceae bacterium]|jgi:predicted nucleotidyltransferase|nr:nucleotidyltransferase domain-containing protein [Spirochaetaceae bacterium]